MLHPQPLRNRPVPERYKRITIIGGGDAFAVNPDLTTTHFLDSSLFLFVGVRVAFDLSLVDGYLDSLCCRSVAGTGKLGEVSGFGL